MKELGDYLRKKREEKGLSQTYVSKASRLGNNAQFLSNIERGVSKIPPKHIKTVCKIIGADPKKVATLLVKEYTKRVKDSVK